MASRRPPWEVTLRSSPMSIRGIPLQGPFDLDDLHLERFHSEEAHTHYYTAFRDRHIKIKCLIDLRAFLDTLLTTIICERD